MGNVSGRGDGEGTSSGDQRDTGLCEEEGFEQFHPRAMLGFSSFNPMAYLLPSSSTSSQIPTTSLPAAGWQNASSQRKKAGMFIWSHGGREVALTGSWDNWEKMEPLHPLGKDFVITKMLPPGVYHYRFVVDYQLRYAPEFPWEYDGSGRAFNILNLRDLIPGAQGSPFEFAATPLPPQIQSDDPYPYPNPHPPPPNIIPELRENLVEFESPPSPISSYRNEPLSGEDFSKLPPELPPQLKMTPMPEQSSGGRRHQSLPTPHHSSLNHLCIQNSDTGGQFVALSSTFRFRQKYVTLVLYKAPRR